MIESTYFEFDGVVKERRHGNRTNELAELIADT